MSIVSYLGGGKETNKLLIDNWFYLLHRSMKSNSEDWLGYIYGQQPCWMRALIENTTQINTAIKT